MKTSMKYIQVVLLIGGIVFLYGFSNQRNAKRSFDDVVVEYTNGRELFIAQEAVNNLLIDSSEESENQAKETINLNRIERKLNENNLIANAEVFKTIDGKIGAQITQREPIARVLGQESFYIDKNGGLMPLSNNYSARVPLVSGIDSTEIETVFPLLKTIEKDDFLKKYITGITKASSGDFILNMRKSPLTVNFGDVSEIKQKVRNFKAFYKKAFDDELLEKYSSINLKYINQVVCKKKEEA